MSSGLRSLLRNLRALALCALVCAVIPARAALQPGFSVQLFLPEDGLPQNNINSIVQSRDGYLWLATVGGLARFDGVRFKLFDAANTPELPNSRMTALFEDGAGVIWIGHETGDLSRLRNGAFEAVAMPGASHREPVVAIIANGQGTPMLFFQSGALRNSQTGALFSAAASNQRGGAACVRDASGAIWILRAGSLWRLDGEKIEAVELDRYAADQHISGIGAARDGGVWIATRGTIRKRQGDQWTAQMFAPWTDTEVTAMLEMRDGVVAAATREQGIWLMRANAAPMSLDRNDGLPPDWVRALCEDSEGNLWVGLGSSGMVALRPARAVAPKTPDRWKGRPVSALAITRDEHIWIGTEGAGLYRYVNGACLPFNADLGLPANSVITSLAEDGAGQLWVGAAENGLYIFDGQKFQSPVSPSEFASPIRALLPQGDAMLIGARSGLFKYENKTLQPLATNLIAADVRCIAAETNGVIWFGMFGGGLGRLENGAAKQFRKAEGLGSDFIQALHLDSDNTLWIGSADSGLTRCKDGKFTSITTAQGLRDNVICHIADDGGGHLWISSSQGIMRISKSDLTQVQPLTYAETDIEGLASPQGSGGFQPSGARAADGTLWFSMLKNIVAVNPSAVRANQLPRVLIEELRVNDRPAKIGGASIAIPAGGQRFDLDFTAITFAAPERAQFKYRLEGLDDAWIGPTTRRTVSYNYLPPADYNFRVIASNSDGAWNETGATLAFTVLPFFWQTIWFRVLVAASAVALVGLAVLFVTRQRYRRQLELAERQRGIERERARIAQDIHDDLGSSLTRIILLSQSARGDLDSPEIAAGDLDRIYDTARNLTRSLDEIVWAVNPRHDTLDSLATYLGKFAQDFLGAAQIRCRLDLPTALPAWPLTAETRHNVFLAFKEALHNTVKHAQATEVKITLALQSNAFTLTVEDNGQGFDPAAPSKDTADTEDGLANMRKRLTDIGGACQIASTPGQGTRIEFLVPRSHAGKALTS